MAFLVVYDDESGLCLPMGSDIECKGAICTSALMPVIFESRAKAKQAIKISRLFAQLQAAQGVPGDSDFLGFYNYVKIRKCEVAD